MTVMQASKPAAPPSRPPADHDDVDEVVVERILGYRTCPANRAERYAVVDRWRHLGRPLNDLQRLTGWNVQRMLRERRQAAPCG